MDAGERMMEESTYYRRDDRAAGAAECPPPVAAGQGLTVELPPPRREGGCGLWQALQERRSIRNYARAPLSLEELGQVLWAQNGRLGVTGPKDRRTAPSAGARYAIETYVIVNNVEGVPLGVYHYDARGHRLAQRRAGDASRAAAAAAYDQKMAGAAAVVLVWTAVVERTRGRYGLRAYRYLHLDAGHIGQNLHLAAAAMGLGCCMVGSFYDHEVDALVGAGGADEVALYVATLGRPAS